MATETLYALTSITGSVSTPNNALGAPDTVCTTDTNNTNWTCRWGMGTPTGSLSGTQTIIVRCRESATNNAAPTLAINLYENNVLVQSVMGATVPGSGTTLVDLQGTFDASAISDKSLVQIELVAVGTNSGGQKATIQVDSITWSANTVSLSTVSNTLPSAWSARETVGDSQASAWSARETVGASADSAWDVLTTAATETLYGSAIANNVSTITTGNNSIGAANDAWTTDSNRLWYALWDMENATGMLPDTATLNLRLRMSSGSGQTYDVALYEADKLVEVIATNQSVANAAATYQHTINIGKIKDPTQIQIRMETSTNWTETVQIDALWIEFTPVTGKVRASVDAAWDVYGGATEVAVWDFFYPSRTPEPASVAPGWNVSAWAAGPGMNSGLGVGGTDYDQVYRNYFVAGAQPTSAYPTEPVARVASISTGVADAITNDRYIEMTFSRADSGAFTPAGLAIKTARGGSATPRGAVIRSSHNAYALDVGTFGNFKTVRPTWEQWNIDLSGIGEVTTLTLRMYIYSTGSTSTVAFDDIVLTATPTATTTPVSNSFSTAWDADGRISATRDTEWSTRNTVSPSFSSSWSNFEVVSDGVTASWSISSVLEASKASAWSVWETVADSVTSAWNVQGLQTVGASVASAWSVRETVADSVTSAWSARALVSDTASSAWSLRETVTDSTPAAWSIRSTTGDTFTSGWNVEALGQVSQSVASAWMVLQGVSDEFDTQWGILSTTEISLFSAWSVGFEVVGTIISAWSSSFLLGKSLQSAWSIMVDSHVQNVISSAWTVRGMVETGIVAGWTQFTTTPGGIDSAWSTLTSVSGTVVSEWSILETLGTPGTLATGWSLLATIDTETATSWNAIEGFRTEYDVTVVLGSRVWAAAVAERGWTGDLDDRRHAGTMGENRFVSSVGARRMEAST